MAPQLEERLLVLPMPHIGPAAAPLRRRMGYADRIFRSGIAAFALALVLVLLSLFGVLAWESSGSIRRFGISFLFSTTWDPVFERFGALTFIFGTVVSSFLALL